MSSIGKSCCPTKIFRATGLEKAHPYSVVLSWQNLRLSIALHGRGKGAGTGGADYYLVSVGQQLSISTRKGRANFTRSAISGSNCQTPRCFREFQGGIMAHLSNQTAENSIKANPMAISSGSAIGIDGATWRYCCC